jgi:hypothetical protein
MTADERFAKIRIKVERARQHIQELKDSVRRFLASAPYEVQIQEKPDIGRRVYYLSRVEPVPLAIAAIAGDVLHNLRSALDHTAFQLVSVGMGRAPSRPWEIDYPVADDATRYVELRNRKLSGARKDAVDAVDATRPYKGGNDTIWRIHQLNNIDKHRLLLTVGSAFKSMNISPIMQSLMRQTACELGKERDIVLPPVYLKPADRLFPLQVGDELLLDALHHEIQPKIDFRFGLAFGESETAEGDSLVETLQDMADAVDKLVASFRPFLV